MANEAPDYVGRIDRAPDGSIVGELIDRLGARLVITGHRDIENGGYVLSARVEIAPDGALHVPMIDGDGP